MGLLQQISPARVAEATSNSEFPGLQRLATQHSLLQRFIAKHCAPRDGFKVDFESAAAVEEPLCDILNRLETLIHSPPR